MLGRKQPTFGMLGVDSPRCAVAPIASTIVLFSIYRGAAIDVEPTFARANWAGLGSPIRAGTTVSASYWSS